MEDTARTQFTFYDSFYRSISRIKKKADRADAYDAIVAYALLGQEPDLDKLPDAAAIAFEVIRPNLDASRRKSESGKKGGRPKKQDESKPKASEKQTESSGKANGKQEQAPEFEKQEKEQVQEQVQDKDKEQKLKGAPSASKARAVFVPPSVDEVRVYCQQRQNGIDPQSFVDFYTSKGWLVGKTKMSDWKAAVRTWESRRKQEGGGTGGSNTGNSGGTQLYGTYL